MPYSGTGTFSNLYDWNSDATNGINISSARMQAEATDVANGLSNCITRDGQGVPIAATPWGGQDLSGVGALSGVSFSFSANGTVGGTLGVTGGLLTGTTISDGQGAPTQRLIGYRGFPFTAASAGRTLALTDLGMCIPATGAINIPTNASVAFPIGDMVGVYNNSGSSISITASGGVTLRLGGSATTGTRTLVQRGMVTLFKVGTDEWVALNGGIS